MHVLIVSDTHLSHRTPTASANWAAVCRFVEQHPPDLVLHLGDLCLDAGSEVHDLQFAQQQLDRLGVEYRIIPGNHDVGDSPLPHIPVVKHINEALHQHWLARFGPDYWCERRDGWAILALNAQLFASGWDAEARQWAWLEAQWRASSFAAESIVLLTHKPLHMGQLFEAADGFLALPEAALRRLQTLFASYRPQLVVSGHVHQFLQDSQDGIQCLWVPSTWSFAADGLLPALGTKRCGLVSLQLGQSGCFSVELIEPTGIRHLTAGVDFALPVLPSG